MIFDKCSIFDFDSIEIRFQYWVGSLHNQLLLEFSSIQFKTLYGCYKHIEEVKGNRTRSRDWCRDRLGIGTGAGHGGITCVL